MKIKDYFVIIMLGALWGASLTFSKASLKAGFTLFLLAGTRFFFAGVLTLAYLIIKAFFTRKKVLSELKLDKKDFILVSGLSAFMIFIPFSFTFFAITLIPAGIAGIVGSTIPLFTMFFAHFFTTDEKLNKTKITGAIICISGLALLGLYGKQSMDVCLSRDFYKGFAAGLISSASIGFANVLAKKSRLKCSFTVSTMYQVLIGGSGFFILSAFLDNYAKLAPTAFAYIGALYIVSFGTALPFVIYYGMVNRLGASRLSTVTFIIPFFAIISAFVILSEKLSLMAAAAAIITLAGIYLIIKGNKTKKPDTA